MNSISKSEGAFILAYAKKIRAINLLGGKCEKCGTEDIFVLNFHHGNKDKEYQFNAIRNFRWSIIEKEIKKCTLLCSNCHSEFHCNKNGRRQLEKIKKLNNINVVNLKCNRCGYVGDNYASLHFHHTRGDKKFIINHAINNTIDVSVQELIDEVNKCDILCANCHQREHSSIELFYRLKQRIDFKINNYKELRPALDRDLIKDMYFNQKMRQIDIVRHFKCSKGTISMIIKNLSLPSENGQKATE